MVKIRQIKDNLTDFLVEKSFVETENYWHPCGFSSAQGIEAVSFCPACWAKDTSG
jgi:hypothetical protein